MNAAACWLNLADFREWAAHIDLLASTAPNEPIPLSVICIPAKPIPLTASEMAEAHRLLDAIGKR